MLAEAIELEFVEYGDLIARIVLEEEEGEAGNWGESGRECSLEEVDNEKVEVADNFVDSSICCWMNSDALDDVVVVVEGVVVVAAVVVVVVVEGVVVVAAVVVVVVVEGVVVVVVEGVVVAAAVVAVVVVAAAADIVVEHYLDAHLATSRDFHLKGMSWMECPFSESAG